MTVIGLAYTAFAAVVFAGLTLFLGRFWEAFSVNGPGGFTFFDFYKRYLIVAGAYTFVCSSPGLGFGVFGIPALAAAYKFVFDAGWIQAIVIGIVGGVIAFVLFITLTIIVLVPAGLILGS